MLEYTGLLITINRDYIITNTDSRQHCFSDLQVYGEHDQGCTLELLRMGLIIVLVKKPVNSPENMKLSQVANVGSALLCSNTSFHEQMLRVLSFSHMSVEEYFLQSREQIRKKFVRHNGVSHLPCTSASTYKQYLYVREVTIRHQIQTEAVRWNSVNGLRLVSAWEWLYQMTSCSKNSTRKLCWFSFVPPMVYQ